MKTLALMGLITIALLAGGCCTKTVVVPVSSCPAPPMMTFPVLAVTQLSDSSTTNESLKALASDHLTLKSSLQQCLITLDGYRKKE